MSAAGASQNDPSGVSATSGLPESVLIIEDDLLIAQSVRDLVSGMGVRVVGLAQSGEKGLEMARGHRPAAAIVDIRMPGPDGIETAKALWEEMRIPSVLLTAYGSDNFVQRAAATPVFGYLLKPPSAESVYAALSVGWANACRRMEDDHVVTDLRRTLDQRKVTEKAKWRLVEQSGITEPEAHLALQRAARSSRRTLAEVSQAVINAEDPLSVVRATSA